MEIEEICQAYRHEYNNVCDLCGLETTLLAREDKDCEYYTYVYVQCTCGNYLKFTISINYLIRIDNILREMQGKMEIIPEDPNQQKAADQMTAILKHFMDLAVEQSYSEDNRNCPVFDEETRRILNQTYWKDPK